MGRDKEGKIFILGGAEKGSLSYIRDEGEGEKRRGKGES